MTIEQLREVCQAKPFKPFTIQLADGDRLRVPHPEFLWFHPRGGRTVFVAGPPDAVNAEENTGDGALELSNPQEVLDAWNGKKGGLLWAVSRKDGSKQAAYELDSPPVFDGMAAAEGSLYLCTADGRVVCFRAK